MNIGQRGAPWGPLRLRTCALALAADRDGAEHCRPFDPRPHAPDWPAPRQSGHNPRTDSPRQCEQSIPQLLGRSVAGLGLDVPAIHRTCGQRAFGNMPKFGTMPSLCPVGRQSRHLAGNFAAQSMANLAELRSLGVRELKRPSTGPSGFGFQQPDTHSAAATPGPRSR
jgi:hypothetical protein